jgi:hypothetical protein
MTSRWFFYTDINTVSTKVSLAIGGQYNVNIHFTYAGKYYSFTTIRNWKYTGETQIDSFDTFSFFMLRHYQYTENSPFGSFQKEDGKVVIERIPLNMIRYACVDIFRVWEEIVLRYPNDFGIYCSIHKDSVPDDYESFIHKITCNALLDSKFELNEKYYPRIVCEHEFKKDVLDGFQKIRPQYEDM